MKNQYSDHKKILNKLNNINICNRIYFNDNNIENNINNSINNKSNYNNIRSKYKKIKISSKSQFKQGYNKIKYNIFPRSTFKKNKSHKK